MEDDRRLSSFAIAQEGLSGPDMLLGKVNQQKHEMKTRMKKESWKGRFSRKGFMSTLYLTKVVILCFRMLTLL